MSKLIALFLSIVVYTVATPTPQATATDRYPPLPVGADDVCECIVHNYGTVADTGVVITLYTSSGLLGVLYTQYPPRRERLLSCELPDC